MSDRVYIPPQIGDSSPAAVLSTDESTGFIHIPQIVRGGGMVRSQSIAVFVDGACSRNGMDGAQAAMGVYFGPRSPYNFSQRLQYGAQTSQRAELHSAILALQMVRELVQRGRLTTRTVVLITDSAYVVGAMTEWLSQWRDNGWINARGYAVVNRSDIEVLDGLIYELEANYGIYVQFWWVDREHNQEADKLAKDELY